MNSRQSIRVAVAAALLSTLAACGSDDASDERANFVSSYTSSLSALASKASLSIASFVDLFDAAYLDSGVNKAAVQASLSADADALKTSLDYSSFPGVTLSNAKISSCDAAQICTLTGTLINSDADPSGVDATAVTAVDFSAQVKVGSDGKIRLLGDQTQG